MSSALVNVELANATSQNAPVPRVAIIGGGPAGLMAAEVLSAQGIKVDLYDAMPSVGRKFLLAGRGGLNLTHTEQAAGFLSRYSARTAQIAPLLQQFDAQALRNWAHGLGVTTFVGSSGRVFPAEMKAAPLLRAWLKRLREAGVHFHMRHRWLGWDSLEEAAVESAKSSVPHVDASAKQALLFATPQGQITINADATLLALGGGSWARLGSDGAWLPLLTQRGIAIAPLQPANCGFDVAWSEHFKTRFAGQPLKTVVATCRDMAGLAHSKQGEFVVSENGVEGSLIYALSASLRDRITQDGSATLTLDLLPDKSLERVRSEVAHPRGARSMSSHLQSKVGISGVKAGLLREVLAKDDYANPDRLTAAIKALPIRLTAVRPLDEAISSAGGVRFEALDAHLMLKKLPGIFCAGEMLDWEAPTGGYLLTACFASGYCAGLGTLQHLRSAQKN